MKNCSYCGRENDDAAPNCRECGTNLDPSEIAERQEVDDANKSLLRFLTSKTGLLIGLSCVAILCVALLLLQAWVTAHSIVGYAEKAKNSVDLEVLRAWALKTLAEHQNDAPTNEWHELRLPAPEFVSRIPAPNAGWSASLVLTNASGQRYVRLDSYGIDDAFAIVIGPTNFVRTNEYNVRLAPGIFYEGSSIYLP